MDGLIGLDWGTTRLRAWHIDASGTVRDTHERAWGLRQLPHGGFDTALKAITAGWPVLPVLACGMVASRQGWREVAYVEAPANLAALTRGVGSVTAADGRRVNLVPGVHQHRGPDVMRGEETQLIGALAQRPDFAAHSTWILPGTHSKWASVRDNAIDEFSTVMTGELYAVLTRHSILASGDGASQGDDDAFLRGVIAARDSGTAGATSRLFSARTLMLDAELPAESVADYVSGLLIGEEFRSMIATGCFDCGGPIQLIGGEALCQRYQDAGTHFGLTLAAPVADAAAHGLWEIACHAEALGHALGAAA